MLEHEAKLIDPDADAVVGALTAAAAAANKRCRVRLIEDEPDKWRAFARAAAKAREGYKMFHGGRGGRAAAPTPQVLAAWWTDAARRKHVVVRGRRVELDKDKRALNAADLADRPPLWHAYPEYVCRRFGGDRAQVVCACGCGAVGAPESLGWMGETCGPCFDRKEEAGAGALAANLPGVLSGAGLGPVACSPAGDRVAAVEGGDGVAYWDLAARSRATMKFGGRAVTGVAITADGRHLLVTGTNVQANSGFWAAYDLSADPPQRVGQEREFDSPAWQVIALPDPGRAIVHRPERATGVALAVVTRVPSGEPEEWVALARAYHAQAARSPDGTRLVLCGESAAVFVLATGRRIPLADRTVGVMAFSHDGRRLFAPSTDGLLGFDAATGRRERLPPRDQPLAAPAVVSVAADPAGEWVYAAGPDGRLSVFDAEALERKFVFEWHVDGVRGLAVSADGARLFSSGGDGCVKVWPIRDLLRGG